MEGLYEWKVNAVASNAPPAISILEGAISQLQEAASGVEALLPDEVKKQLLRTQYTSAIGKAVQVDISLRPWVESIWLSTFQPVESTSLSKFRFQMGSTCTTTTRSAMDSSPCSASARRRRRR